MPVMGGSNPCSLGEVRWLIPVALAVAGVFVLMRGKRERTESGEDSSRVEGAPTLGVQCEVLGRDETVKETDVKTVTRYFWRVQRTDTGSIERVEVPLEDYRVTRDGALVELEENDRTGVLRHPEMKSQLLSVSNLTTGDPGKDVGVFLLGLAVVAVLVLIATGS